MFSEDPNWFVSLVMLYIPIVAAALAARAAWTRRHVQTVSVPLERGKRAWIS